MTQKPKKTRAPRIHHHYSIGVWCHPTQEMKEKAERAEWDEEAAPWILLPERIEVKHFYSGWSKPKTVWSFFKAAEFAAHHPLSFRLFVRFDFEGHPPSIDLWLKHRR